MLCVVHTNDHSPCTFSNPRNKELPEATPLFALRARSEFLALPLGARQTGADPFHDAIPLELRDDCEQMQLQPAAGRSHT
jgi:hypothetical protein